jgi:hypothetical protein
MRFPRLFQAHPNLCIDVNRNIVQAEIDGGVKLQDLGPGSTLHIRTQHTLYLVLVVAGNLALISGHPRYCPQPVLVEIAWSTWGGSILETHFIGRGMRLEFRHPKYRTPIVTSPIHEIRESPQSPTSQMRALDGPARSGQTA